MSSLLFVRHAETDMAGSFCGHSDPPINVAGREQLRHLIAGLEGEPFDAIYSSDLRRATDTAEAMAAAFELPVVTTDALREIYFGEWEGLRWEEIERRDPAYASRWLAEFPKLPAPQGERYEEFTLRVLNAVDQLWHASDGGRIVLVTHAGVMRVVLTVLLNYSAAEAWEKTRGYYCSFEYTGAALTQRMAR